MKAMVIEQFGGPEAFRQADRPDPDVQPNHLLIRVAASSVNPVDIRMRAGMFPAATVDLPAVLHGDVAGTVEAVGAGVTRFRPGDAVYACAVGVRGQSGALAELMLANADLAALKPQSLSFENAAALPLVGITAYEALVERARVRPGQRVLVHGGTGGVGHVGVQLARCAGAVVYATVSSDEKAGLARQLGADVAINYRQQSVAECVAAHTAGQGFDVVLDTVGSDTLAASFAAAAVGGTVVSVAARSTQDLTPLHSKGLTLHVVFMLLPMLTGEGRARHGKILARLARLVDCGRVCPLLDRELFSFRDVGAAHRKLEEGRAIGKIRLLARF